ncbi:MAG: Ig-like domain-containing protein, partial [Oscillospiraceae bacterium]|nr:Ig-like domain-containing protein [Oscillospiraceae bacterium]
TASLSLTGAMADSWESSDAAIAEVDNDGVVTGKAIGRVTITAKKDGEKIASIEIPVVGENLLIRNGVNHGKFEGGTESLFDDKSGYFVTGNKNLKAQHFWYTPTSSNSGSARYPDAVTIENITTSVSSATPALKFTISKILTSGSTTRKFELRTATMINNTSDYADYAYGAIETESGKLYELSGWAKFDHTKMRNLYGTVKYYKEDGTTASTALTAVNDKASLTASNEWQYFNTMPVARYTFTDAIAAQMFFSSSYSDTADATSDIYFADLSFHEVAYDLQFKSQRHFNNREVGFTAKTDFSFLSNTGKEIVSFDSDGNVVDIPVVYNSTNPEVATINESGVITAVGVGTTTISVTVTVSGKEIKKELDPLTIYPKTDTEVTTAFTPDNTDTDAEYDEPAVIAISKDGVDSITSAPNGDGTHTVTAPATNKAGKKFLYWAKGLTTQKKILLYKTNELTDYLPDGKYANYLIPVYEDDISAPEYYNANGQLIPGANQTTTVSMPGYGTSIGWDKYGENIYVAKYEFDEPEENITITTINCATDKGKYAFGDVVTCTANGEGKFRYWMKDNEIVGNDTTYSFKAWKNHTVEAVYTEEDYRYTGAKMKIIIDSFSVDNETGVMAEFIGLSGAVEKGIMFTDKESGDTTNIAMTTKDSQFTVIADKAGTYAGYAILRNGDAYTLITDGEYIHN